MGVIDTKGISSGATVRAYRIEGYAAWMLEWEQVINKDEIAPVFRKIVRALDASDEPLYVVVDLTKDPEFPMSQTINAALWGPFRHKRLQAWLVVGSNRTAQVIGRTLNNLTRRDNIVWYETVEEAFAYLDALKPSA
jgi:hypothetical protein